MGIATILRARNIILMATGEKKAEIVRQSLKAGIGPEVPATALRTSKISKVKYFLDNDAAKLL